MNYKYHYISPLGGITITGDGNALTGLLFDNETYFDDILNSGGTGLADYEDAFLPVFGETVKWLDIYFSGKEPEFTPPLDLIGTEFRRSVWNILLEIPYGKTVTYGDIAKRLAAEKGVKKMAPQAVGGAVGHNPISIIVPCHRVIGSGGSLVGYGGGIDVKARLLELEQRSGL